MLAQLTKYGKEIESMGNPLMDEIFERFSLMYENYIEENQIEAYFLAFGDDGSIIGFLGVGYCGRSILLEVREQEQRGGVGSALIAFAVGCGHAKAWQPRQNGCEEFWRKMEDVYL